VTSRLQPSSETGAADWIRPRLVAGDEAPQSTWGVAFSFVPFGFDRYVRIFHPVEGSSDERASWADIAAWSGKAMHARVEFEVIQQRMPAPGAVEVSDSEPEVGRLAPDLVEALASVLGRHTEAAQRCWFCIWEGGWISGPASLNVSLAASPAERAAIQARYAAGWDLPFGREALDRPRVQLPGRSYVLLEGPLDAVVEIGAWQEWQGRSSFEPNSPNLWWPDDRSWCVGTEIDHQSTFVGGSDELVGDLLLDARFETFEIDPADSATDAVDRS
jgi:hypothetical protein